MASIFNTGLIPHLHQGAAEDPPHRVEAEFGCPQDEAVGFRGHCVPLARGQAEWEAEQNAIAAEKLARKMAGIEKRRATLAAKKSSKKA